VPDVPLFCFISTILVHRDVFRQNLVIQHAMHMLCIISSMAYLALSYFSILSHKWHDSQKNSYCISSFVFFKFLQNFV